MSERFPDLDSIVKNHALLARIEASPPFRYFTKSLGADPKRYERDGLGIWLAFPVEVKPLGEFIIAAPEHDMDAGSSIWFEQNELLTEGLLAAAICVICKDRQMLFMTTDGDFINPNFDGIKSFRSPEPREIGASSSAPEADVAENAILKIIKGVRRAKAWRSSRAGLLKKTSGISKESSSFVGKLGRIAGPDEKLGIGELDWTFPKLENKAQKRM